LAYFSYSLDGKSWNPIGEPLKMTYTLPHFMGYRFGLFNYATQQLGGYADFDYFHITNQISTRPKTTN
jgi:beta-xylosidase